jgi:hypothetical protein
VPGMGASRFQPVAGNPGQWPRGWTGVVTPKHPLLKHRTDRQAVLGWVRAGSSHWRTTEANGRADGHAWSPQKMCFQSTNGSPGSPGAECEQDPAIGGHLRPGAERMDTRGHPQKIAPNARGGSPGCPGVVCEQGLAIGGQLRPVAERMDTRGTPTQPVGLGAGEGQ